MDRADRDSEAQSKKLINASQTLKAAEAEQAAAVAALHEHISSLLPVRSELLSLEEKLKKASGRLPQWIERVREKQREEEIAQLAATLAEGLQQGRPCPVCGSCEHPQLTAHGEQAASIGIAPLEREGEQAASIGIAPLEQDDEQAASSIIAPLEQEEEQAVSPSIASWERAQGQASELLMRIAPLRSKVETACERLYEAIPSTSGANGALYTEAGHSLSAVHALPAAVHLPFNWEREAAAAGSVDSAAGQHGDAWLLHNEPDGDTLHALQAVLAIVSDTYTAQEQWVAAAEAGFSASRSLGHDGARRYEIAESELRAQTALKSEMTHKRNELAAAMGQELASWTEQFGNELPPEHAQERLQQYEQREHAALELNNRLERSVSFIEETSEQLSKNEKLVQSAQLEAAQLTVRLDSQRQQLSDKQQQLQQWTGGEPAGQLLQAAERELAHIRSELTRLQDLHEAAGAALQKAAELRSAAEESARHAETQQAECAKLWLSALEQSQFETADEVKELQPLLSKQEAIAGDIDRYRATERQLAAQIELLRDQLQGRSVTVEEWEQCVLLLEQSRLSNESALQASAKAERNLEELTSKQDRWQQLETIRKETELLGGRLKSLQSVFRGNAFVEYVAEEQLVQVCRTASERLGFLTKRRYALEVDSGGGFVIRDDANGGIRRPVSSLSGGETFLASLALALALSGQIQLRGKYPLQFFFLDEGFGTLDPELLDTVITALEKLQSDTLSVGVISHVTELRARLPRRLIVTASEPAGRGSQVALETM
ncbi:hypothetical protein PAECIP111893_04630 [Paenibacillus plantiphilus]|uniref:Nuclease SbcCD subunit C n=1 Tax=Paenibacillus plantiphilus TaxID=2905650 RepID=A0ABN8H087_9BACL|nr:hypothetical protein PAECIP111893_04630 [Paenibacillus plantiphilus]